MVKANALYAALLMGACLSAHAAATPHKIAYLTSWGLSDPAALEKSEVDTYILSFGQWDSNGNISSSDNLVTAPPYNDYWLPPGYTAWTNLKRNNPQRKIMLAFGGQTYESIWSYITTPEAREILAQNIVALLTKDFPVYTKGLTASQLSGDCLSSNWDGICNLNNYQKAGTVQIDGVDFDFEKAARITPEESANLLALAMRIKALAPANKIMSLTTYHVGADPVECANSGVVENCSYIETDRSAHHGEVSDLLVQSKNLFNFFNVMTYDAGKNFKYQVALQNYANKVGDKTKVVLGNTINAQWAPTGPFVETDENNNARAKWQAQNGFGGLFVWNFGANSQQLSMAEQVAKTNAMIAAMSSTDTAADLVPPVTPTPVTPTEVTPAARKELITLTSDSDIRSANVGALLQTYKSISVITRDGAWTGSFVLPASGVAEGSVFKFQRAASWPTDIVSQEYGVDTPLPGEVRTYTYSNGAWHSDGFTITKQVQFDAIGNKPDGLSKYVSTPTTTTIVLADGAWTQNIYLPATASEGATVKLIRYSSWANNLLVGGTAVKIPRGTSATYQFKAGVWMPATLDMTFNEVINALNTSPASLKNLLLEAQKINAVIQIRP
ncbi:hypothetical protein ACVW0Y_004085 [Pseudomonas sp. TE3786]